jgi:hypothetical protein
VLAENLILAFLADFPDGLVDRGLAEGLTRSINPYPVLFPKLRISSRGTQGDFITRAFHLEGISGLQPQFVAQRLRENDSPGLVECQSASHNGILYWYFPFVNGNPQLFIHQRLARLVE